jgi:hypothetical protein
MLHRYSKARSATIATSQNDVTQTYKPPNFEIYEKRVQELTKAIDESQKKADHVSIFCECMLLFHFLLINNGLD